MQSYKQTFNQGCCGLIRSGEDTRVWEDPWIPNNENFKPYLANDLVARDPNVRVMDLMTKNDWHMELLYALFDTTTISNVVKIIPSAIRQKDESCWIKNKSGFHIVKSHYLLE